MSYFTEMISLFWSFDLDDCISSFYIMTLFSNLDQFAFSCLIHLDPFTPLHGDNQEWTMKWDKCSKWAASYINGSNWLAIYSPHWNVMKSTHSSHSLLNLFDLDINFVWSLEFKSKVAVSAKHISDHFSGKFLHPVFSTHSCRAIQYHICHDKLYSSTYIFLKYYLSLD